jgi:hypothetical protein
MLSFQNKKETNKMFKKKEINMYLSAQKIISRVVFLAISILILVNSASAGVEISDFFSYFTSSDVTVNSTQDFQGKAVFELYYAGNPVESHEVPLK